MPQGIWGCPEGALTGAVPADLRLINTQAIFAHKTGMIILGGGLVKHHIANANLMVRGAPGWGGGVGPPGVGRGRGAHPGVALGSGTAPTSPSTSTRRRSSTAPTRARGRTRPCPGARSAWTPAPSRWGGLGGRGGDVGGTGCGFSPLTPCPGPGLCRRLARVPAARGRDVCPERRRLPGARGDPRGLRDPPGLGFGGAEPPPPLQGLPAQRFPRCEGQRGESPWGGQGPPTPAPPCPSVPPSPAPLPARRPPLSTCIYLFQLPIKHGRVSTRGLFFVTGVPPGPVRCRGPPRAGRCPRATASPGPGWPPAGRAGAGGRPATAPRPGPRAG